MRVLLVSDLHYRLRQYDWIAGALDAGALDIDVLVIAGDQLDIRSAVPLDAQAVAISAQLAKLARLVPVLAASGNHDLDGRDAAGEKAARWLEHAAARSLATDGASVHVGDVLFTICPWWDGPVGRDNLQAQLEKDAAADKRRWVWVHHAPPTGSPLAWDGRREFGDDALAEWIPRFAPDMVLTGHIHQAPFVDGGGWAQQIGSTWLFNAGHQPGPAPTHIVIDTHAGYARWQSATERREVTLTAF